MIFPAAFPIRDTLSILVQIVCLVALCAPLSIFFQRPERQHDMDMRVAGSLVMDGKVGAHSFVYKVVLHIGTHKGKLLFAGQFTGQSCLNLAGELLSLAFSICSTLFQRIERSANDRGAWSGSMISAWTMPPFRV